MSGPIFRPPPRTPRKPFGIADRTQVVPRRPAGQLTVMTRNLCLGADLDPIRRATEGELADVVAQVFNQAKASDFPGRAQAWAAEIEYARPDLIGLQEVVILSTQPWPPDPTSASVVEADFLELLLAQLLARNLSYEVVAEELSQEILLPGRFRSGVLGVKLTQREVILARSGAVTLTGRRGGRYPTFAKLTMGSNTVPLPWAWAAIDATIDGHAFRFATTHLEPDDGVVQVEQAKEFLTGPAGTQEPMIWVGDFNSDAEGGTTYTMTPPSTPTYRNIIDDGFSDAWTATNPTQPGFTCCQRADLVNSESELDTRVDLILTRGDLAVVDAYLVGDKPGSGLWPSDHAGVVVTLDL